MYAIEEYEHEGYTIAIYPDDEPESPREWDNLGTMVCFHRRYNALGDKHDFNSKDYSSWGEIEAAILHENPNAVILPLYLYDHSGLRIKVGSFQGLLPQGHAEFDSGCIGFIFCSVEKIKKEYGVKRVSKQQRRRIAEILRGEIDTYDTFISGQVVGYQVKRDDEIVDSCWGYYSIEDAKKEAENYVHFEKENRQSCHV
jgi:hypothetical protein